MRMFGQIYARILDESGIRVDTGRYIGSMPFTKQMREYGDPTLESPGEYLHKLAERYAARMAAGQLKGHLDDVRLIPRSRIRWTVNPFSMILPISPPFSGYLRRYQEAQELRDGAEKDTMLRDLEAERQKLSPSEIVKRGQAIYQLFYDMPTDLRDELLGIAVAWNTGIRAMPKMQTIKNGLGKFLKNRVFEAGQLPEPVADYTETLLGRLAEYVTADTYPYFGFIADRIKLACNSPECSEGFVAQTSRLIGTDIGTVPSEWSEGSLAEDAVRGEHDNLRERLEELKKLRRIKV